MKQRLTTILLVLLVLSSLLLTYQLWYGRHRYDPIDEEGPERVFFELPRSLADTITPERILVKAGDGYHLLRHGQEHFVLIWGELSSALQALIEYDYRARESLEDNQPDLRIYFDPLLPVGSGTPWLGKDRYREISKLELWFGEEGTWIVLYETAGGDELALKLPGQVVPTVREAFSEELPHYELLTPEMLGPLTDQLAIKGELAVPLPPIEMPELYLNKEILDQDSLVSAFFVDRSLVRKIQEKSGAVIYTDGAKGLRIRQGIEFSDPVQEKSLTNLSYLSILSACSKYICSYGGWPKELRLQKIIIKNGDRHPLYRAYWKYYRGGYPLVEADQAVSLAFSGSGLVEYCRVVHTIQPSSDTVCQITPYLQALEESIDIYYRRYGEAAPLILEAIDLVYAETGFPHQPEAVPAWLIQINEERIILKAGDLSPLEGDGL